MRVYNFSPENHAVSNLENNRIKVATIEDLNDPFELNAAKQPTKEMRRVFHGFTGDMHEKFGLICFAESWSNPVMWSHYADKHRGVCLGFDVPDKYLIKVKYINSRLAIEFDDNEQENINSDFVQKLFSTKFSDWEYEKEWRMFIGLDETDPDSGLYFYNFNSDMLLKEVILGSRCQTTTDSIKTILSGSEHNISIIKSRLAFKSFSVVRNKRVPVLNTAPNNALNQTGAENAPSG